MLSLCSSYPLVEKLEGRLLMLFGRSDEKWVVIGMGEEEELCGMVFGSRLK